MVAGLPFSGDLGKAMVKGVDIIAGFRDQPIDDEATQHKHSKNTSTNDLNHCLVFGTMNQYCQQEKQNATVMKTLR